jgi:VanZ family protein
MPFEPSDRHARLPRVLLGAYLCALVYGSLYPWSGWRDLGGAWFAFLVEPWPRYWTWFDVLANVLVYLPVGALLHALLRRASGPVLSVLLASFAGALLSLALEALQGLLPARVPSRLDWLANVCGAVLGALAGAALWVLASRRRSAQRPRSWSADSAVGPALLVAWLAVQMHPQRLLFGNGDLVRPLLAVWFTLVDEAGAGEPPGLRADALAAALRLDPEVAVLIEAAGTASAIVALGMLIREIFRARAPRGLITGATIAAAALIRGVTAAVLFGPAHALAWLTAGAQGGVVVGTVLLAVLAAARRHTRLAICIAALALTAALTCVFPVDVYYESAIGRWDRGAWRNFGGLLDAAALAWPFVAIGWCAVRLAALRSPRRPIIRAR